MSDVVNRVEGCRAGRFFLTYSVSVLSCAALMGTATHWYTCLAYLILFLFVWLLNPLPDTWHSELLVSGVACGYVVFDTGLQGWCGRLSAMLLLCLISCVVVKVCVAKKSRRPAEDVR